MFTIKVRYTKNIKNILMLLITMALGVLFSRTELSNSFIMIIAFITVIFIIMFIWYMFSTFLVQRFRYYHNYVTKYYRKYLSYVPIISILLYDLVFISIIITLSQLKISTNFKSSVSFMAMIFFILLSVKSLYEKYCFYSLLKKKDDLRRYLEKIMICQHKYDRDIDLFKIINKLPLYPLDMSMNYRDYNNKLVNCINNINGIHLNNKQKKQVYLNLRRNQ